MGTLVRPRVDSWTRWKLRPRKRLEARAEYRFMSDRAVIVVKTLIAAAIVSWFIFAFNVEDEIVVFVLREEMEIVYAAIFVFGFYWIAKRLRRVRIVKSDRRPPPHH